jgi:hypothetical protein
LVGRGCSTKEEEKVRDLTRACLYILEPEEDSQVSPISSDFYIDDCLYYRLADESDTKASSLSEP